MAIPTHEREKMLAVRLCGPRVIARLESIGITKLETSPTAIRTSSFTKSTSPPAGQSGGLRRPRKP
jgi:hypothetical protein